MSSISKTRILHRHVPNVSCSKLDVAYVHQSVVVAKEVDLAVEFWESTTVATNETTGRSITIGKVSLGLGEAFAPKAGSSPTTETPVHAQAASEDMIPSNPETTALHRLSSVPSVRSKRSNTKTEVLF